MNKRKAVFKITILFLIAGLLLHGCAKFKARNEGNLADHGQESQEGRDGETGQNGESAAGSETRADENEQDETDRPGGDDAKPGDEGGHSGSGNSGNGNDGSSSSAGTEGKPGKLSPAELEKVKPNEAGRIMVVMFHNFIEEYEKGDKEFTMTFDAFRELLGTLYESGYRLISLNDYISGNINTPAGFIPMVFTFDDGTSGQFNLVEENGEFRANPLSAVGIMEEFSKTHPDFGLEGTFFVNLGNRTFGSAGTLEQRLRYLAGKGFEIGNHTYSHINLKKDAKTAEIIQREIGGNQKKMYELIPGYTLNAFSLPYGAPSPQLMQYVIEGEYEGVTYNNKAIMEVGAEPAPSPFNVRFNPLSISRVRSPGIMPVDQDLTWWLANTKRENQYVSDGNPDTVTVPESRAEQVNRDSLGGRELVIY